MELWIRSQNKGTLMKVEILGQTDGIIKAYFSNGNIELGTYKNVERALEVLDEIQNALLENDRYDFTQPPVLSNITNNLIFEMPKE